MLRNTPNKKFATSNIHQVNFRCFYLICQAFLASFSEKKWPKSIDVVVSCKLHDMYDRRLSLLHKRFEGVCKLKGTLSDAAALNKEMSGRKVKAKLLIIH